METAKLSFFTESDDWPLTETLILRDGIAQFADQIDALERDERGLISDVEFLHGMDFERTYYGPLTSRIYPFTCVLTSERNSPTAREILTAVRARHFRSQHIASLDEADIPFPGYHPLTENDEIHTDFHKQGIFSHKGDIDAFSGAHGALKRYVADQRLWYVLLHTTPRPHEGFMFSEYVVLFVVGKSPHGDRCIGAVTHQVCHNYCD